MTDNLQDLINEARATQWTLVGTDEPPLEIRMAAALEAQRDELAELTASRDGWAAHMMEFATAQHRIEEALTEHDHADTCASMLNEIYPCNCWNKIRADAWDEAIAAAAWTLANGSDDHLDALLYTHQHNPYRAAELRGES